MKTIDQVIDSSLEIKRALAVKMIKQGYSYKQISELLNITRSFIEKWRALYNKEGASCFAVFYKGSYGYLTYEQDTDIKLFLQSKTTVQLEELISYIKTKFGIVYKSKQSYYDLLWNSGKSWKKTEKENPKKDDLKIQDKKEEIKKNLMKEKPKFFPGNWS